MKYTARHYTSQDASLSIRIPLRPEFRLLSCSAQRRARWPAPRDAQVGACDVRGFIRAEPDHRVRNLLWRAHTAQRDLVEIKRPGRLRNHVGVGHAWGNLYAESWWGPGMEMWPRVGCSNRRGRGAWLSNPKRCELA